MAQRDDSETALVAALVARDRDVFATLYHQHTPGMIRFATRMTRNRALAEDLVQDTWVSVLDHIATFEGRASLVSWIYAILLNKTRSRTQREARQQSLDAAPDGSDADSFDATGHWKLLPALWDELTPERIVAGRHVLEIVNAAIDDLPDQQKTILLLRGTHGLSGDEICELLSISAANVRVSLHRARLAVRAALDQALA